MGKVRKQPKRTTKKINQTLMRNIFADQNTLKNVIPKSIMANILKVIELPVFNLEELIPEPLRNQVQLNLQLMKSAMSQQQIKVSHLQEQKANALCLQLDSFNFPLRDQLLREETKKTMNTNHSYPEEMHELNSDQDQLFCDLNLNQIHSQKNQRVDQSFMEIDDDILRNVSLNMDGEIDFYSGFQKELI